MKKAKIFLTGEQINYLLELLKKAPDNDPRLYELIEDLQKMEIITVN